MKNALILCIILGSFVFALDPFVGDIGCDPWWVVDTSSLGDGPYCGLSVVNDTIAWAVGHYNKPIRKRTGGLFSYSWSNITAPGNNSYAFNDVCFISPSTGWIVGQGKLSSNKYEGVVYYTTNAGQTWTEQTMITGLPDTILPGAIREFTRWLHCLRKRNYPVYRKRRVLLGTDCIAAMEQ